MRKFIIGIGGRSGSTLYTSLLDSLYMLQFFEHYEKRFFHSDDINVVDWGFPIQHTHQQSIFFSAPDEFERVWARRNFLDMIVSQLVAEETNVYHIFSEQQRNDYVEKFAKTKIQLDANKIKDMLHEKAHEVQDILNSINKLKEQEIACHELCYSVHAKSPEAFFGALNIDITIDPALVPVWPKPMSVDKWMLVDNIEEIMLQYKQFECNNDVDRESTLAILASYI